MTETVDHAIGQVAPPDAARDAVLEAVASFLETGSGPELDRLRASYEAYQVAAAVAADAVERTDALVDRFAAAIKVKLARADARHGWDNAWASADWEVECRTDLGRHVVKGDPLDVAAYAAFCWHHGWSTAPSLPELDETGPWTTSRAFELGFVWRGMVHDFLADRRGDSRDVGRTLTSPIFAGLALDLDAIPNFRPSSEGVVVAKRVIARALEDRTAAIISETEIPDETRAGPIHPDPDPVHSQSDSTTAATRQGIRE